MSPNQRETISAQSSITGLQEYLTSTGGALDVNASFSPPALQNVNLTQVGGAAVALGQTTMSASLPVTLASNQSVLTVQANNLDIRDLVFATDKVDASGSTLGANNGVDIGDVTINNASGGAAVNIQDGGNSITVDQPTGSNLHVVVDSGAITPAVPSTLIAFVTAVTTAGTRVQLASNAITNGFIIEAPSTNTGIIYVGTVTVSSTVYGAQLQPGQSVGLSVSNTNLVYIDSSANGDKAAVLGG